VPAHRPYLARSEHIRLCTDHLRRHLPDQDGHCHCGAHPCMVQDFAATVLAEAGLDAQAVVTAAGGGPLPERRP